MQYYFCKTVRELKVPVGLFFTDVSALVGDDLSPMPVTRVDGGLSLRAQR